MHRLADSNTKSVGTTAVLSAVLWGGMYMLYGAQNVLPHMEMQPSSVCLHSGPSDRVVSYTLGLVCRLGKYSLLGVCSPCSRIRMYVSVTVDLLTF